MQTKIKKNNQPTKKVNRKHKDFMVPEQRTESRDAWSGTTLAGAQRGSAELPADLTAWAPRLDGPHHTKLDIGLLDAGLGASALPSDTDIPLAHLVPMDADTQHKYFKYFSCQLLTGENV